MIRAALALVAVLALAGCGGDGGTQAEEQPEEQVAAPAGDRGVLELENVLQLRSDFEADAGKTRVLLLFSPT